MLFQDLSTSAQSGEPWVTGHGAHSLVLPIANRRQLSPWAWCSEPSWHGGCPASSPTTSPNISFSSSPEQPPHFHVPISLEESFPFSLLKTLAQSIRAISDSPSLHRPSSLCPVPLQHSHLSPVMPWLSIHLVALLLMWEQLRSRVLAYSLLSPAPSLLLAQGR